MIGEHIGSVWVNGGFKAGAGPQVKLFDPSTGALTMTMQSASGDDVDEAVKASHAAFNGEWSSWTPQRRGELCLAIARIISTAREDLVDLVVADTGLPLWMARADADAAARYFEYYAGLADKLSGHTVPLGTAAVDYTVREPWGVCAAILPFNVPVQMAARSVAAALISGNTMILKPADQAPLAQLYLPQLIHAAGAPLNVVTAVAGPGEAAGAALVSHQEVDHVTFTGSLSAGRQVMAIAAGTVKPVLLELGGKSPHLVFDDADLERAVPAIVSSALRTAGQVCSAGSRVLVARDRFSALVSLLGSQADMLRVGPAAEDPDVGPVVSAEQRTKIVAGVETALAEGAQKITDRSLLTSKEEGYFVNPCVLTTEDQANYAAREEIFGPVVVVLPAESDDQVVAMAEDSDYGLVAGIWTNDLSRAHRVAHKLKAGQVFVNAYGTAGGVELPFGGYRRSGFGRLKGIEGAMEYTQVKNVQIAL